MSDGVGRPMYVPMLFKSGSDRYTGDEWRSVWDGFDLESPMGHIFCAECGDDLHVYSADRDDPGYNEHVGHGYIMYDYQVAICGGCLYEAFESIRDVVDTDD